MAGTLRVNSSIGVITVANNSTINNKYLNLVGLTESEINSLTRIPITPLNEIVFSDGYSISFTYFNSAAYKVSYNYPGGKYLSNTIVYTALSTFMIIVDPAAGRIATLQDKENEDISILNYDTTLVPKFLSGITVLPPRKYINFYRSRPETSPIEVKRGDYIELEFVIVYDDDTSEVYTGELDVSAELGSSPRDYTFSDRTITISDTCIPATILLSFRPIGIELDDNSPSSGSASARFNVLDNLGPYNPDGTTKPGQEGGDGLFGDNINDRIEAPDGSAEGPDGAGLYTRYLVTNSTMHVFGEWLWTEDLGLAIAKAAVGLIYGSPSDTLISLVSYPFSVGSIAGTGSSSVKWGGFDTGITWPTLASNAGTIDWGSVSINKYWGNFLDYSPHTKIELYLPWGTGFVEIDTNQIMEGSISVKTNIEFAKGTCVHLVYNHLGSLIGSYSATVGKSLPITASDFASKQVAVAGSAIGLAVGTAISGVSALNAGAESAGAVTYHNVSNPWGMSTSRQYPLISGFSGESSGGEFTRTLPNSARPALQAATAAARMPASYHRSGSFQEGSAGLCVQYPFIILSRPKQSMPESYGHYYGYPCNKVLSLGSCYGYTEVGEVHLDGIPATDAELIEIDRLLKGGVLL